MPKKTSALGKGLDALFAETHPDTFDSEKNSAEITTLPISDIEPDRDQPRKKFDDEALKAPVSYTHLRYRNSIYFFFHGDVSFPYVHIFVFSSPPAVLRQRQ